MLYANNLPVHILPTLSGLAVLDSENFQKQLIVSTKDAPPAKIGEHPVWIGHHYDAMDQKFLKENITFIVSLAEFVPMGWTKHLFWPMRQPHPPEDFVKVARLIEDLVSSGERVLVHCFGGVDRSATAVMVWLVNHRGTSPAEAVELIKTSRPVANPHREWMGW